ncbi:Asp-tRNA(Asn)/Glu-tRNA(Gln) amidotransferase subunit GatC [Candidatus Woesearchaeota archaeon]|nr:hypothetical protein [uncultured archaeon]MBS3129929.1 Asp-tRNA(Asn)/Glu-tRNA(Gln) amidotransferase subunit GatC [Candidatus Woesearchaeota archaeon]HIH38066.1 Asp-tRNA(Asn)/Glu-tRNA(Gln) amidotransferase subunit GatC [Candidatus Woesearchaeota archaeon]HIH48162.1 Asp-tRNA(Asn)/Glu-tRNA(Gln) amidotransferase subunit GatC [Candidatus Woesearchaeota archaeon]HIJ04307.1 Asp-tRNA(Asn)/Glu-tRNA(Gln) amidotransferase subunit GatC [Candidatus Woesearchaeota archaeon]
MELTKDTIKHVAQVARLELTTEEIAKFLPQLKDILEAFSDIAKVDTNNVPPSFQPVPLQDAVRDDEPKPCLTQDQALSLTEHKQDGYFKGPKII